jgi:hypothetical protein
MSEQPAYRREFFKSPHHGWLGLCTLGFGFVSAQPLFMLAGAAAYAIGWVYLPDLPFFRNWVDQREATAKRALEEAQVQHFVRQRDAMLSGLAPARRQQYQALSEVCFDIEQMSGGDATDTEPDLRLRRLDELMWTYLRLLSIEESLERFLAIEEAEKVGTLVLEAEAELAKMRAERKNGEGEKEGAPEPKQRLLISREERLEVLRKRLQRADQARENLALVRAEQDRLAQQIKLIRADAVATRNAGALSARIDATVEHLGRTNRWLAEMDEFKDLVADDLPQTARRVGFATAAPPPLPPSPKSRGRAKEVP